MKLLIGNGLRVLEEAYTLCSLSLESNISYSKLGIFIDEGNLYSKILEINIELCDSKGR